MDELACAHWHTHAIDAGLALIAPGHPELWTALASIATALAGAFRFNHARIRRLRRDVTILKMQVEVHRQVLQAHGFRVPPPSKLEE